MRLAILSALTDPVGHGGLSAGERLAFRRFAGKTVLAHQIDCAAHLGCTRIVCLSGGSGPDIGAARGYAERAGLRFDIVDSILRLSSLVTADDDVLVLADGVLPDRAALIDALGQKAGVAAFAADPALELGFERIDADRAWAGALRMRGAGVARLADLPPDCDLASSLLRIALQSSVQVVQLESEPLADGTWQRRVDRQAAAAAEQRWITRQVRPAPFIAPGLALADRMALRWAQDLGGGRWSRAPHLAAGLMAILALAAGLASWPLLGLVLLLPASFALAVAHVFDRVEMLGAPRRKRELALPAARWLCDALLVALLALIVKAEPGWLRAAMPLALAATLWLGALRGGKRLRALYADRITLLVILLAAALQGSAPAAITVLILLALAEMLWAARSEQEQLTTD